MTSGLRAAPAARTEAAGGRAGLAVVGWSVTSGYGVGAAPFTAGVTGRRAAFHDELAFTPYDRVAAVPGFSAAGHLGRKGTRSMDRVTGLAVAAVSELLAAIELEVSPDDLGLVLGTGNGSVKSIMDFTRDSLLGEKPYHVDPAQFPNTVMNRAAGQAAIWHRITGPNSTVAGGRLTGLLALQYASRLQRAGRCRQTLVGAAEELSEQRAWLESQYRGTATGLGEASVMTLVEPWTGGRPGAARIHGLTFGAYADDTDDSAAGDGARAALAGCLDDAMSDAGLTAGDVVLTLPHNATGPEADVLAGRFPAADTLCCTDLLGDTGAAATSIQLAAALALLQPGRTAVVTAIDPDSGTTGCALVSR